MPVLKINKSGSVAQDAANKLYAFRAARTALQSAMKRRGEEACVQYAPNTALGVYRVKRRVKPVAISHVITGDTETLIEAVQSIQRESEERALLVEIIAILPSGCDRLAERICEKVNVTICFSSGTTSRAACYNQGAQQAKGDVLFFSVGDVEILPSEYPHAALEHTQRSDIGAVGVKLTYPNGYYYHTGLILGVNGFCGYAHRNIWQGLAIGITRMLLEITPPFPGIRWLFPVRIGKAWKDLMRHWIFLVMWIFA